MQVDPQFKAAKARATARRKKRLLSQAALFGGGISALALGVGLVIWWPASDRETEVEAPVVAETPLSEDDAQIVQVDEPTAAPGARLATPFVDIPGDPLILRFETEDGPKLREFAGPETLNFARFGPPVPGRLAVLQEDLVVQESRLITALPSSREDFAFFQAQRTALLRGDPQPAAEPMRDDTALEMVVVDEADSSLGISLDSEGDTPLTYRETAVENTTSIALIRPEAARTPVMRDIVVRLETDRTLGDMLTSNGFSDTELATRLQAVMPELESIIVDGKLPTGAIIAARYRGTGDARQLLHLSVYNADGYISSVSRAGFATFQPSADPWREADLPALAAPAQDVPQTQNFRLLDAVYSAAIRNDVPTTLVGELIVMLSQAYDLEAVATPGDQVTLIYAPNAQTGPGQIVFAGIKGPSGNMPCYVAEKAEQSGYVKDYGCFNATGPRGHSAQTGAGFVTPVNGTLSSPFGPRHHPIHNRVLLHAGVDWAAPSGTPIVAALDGTFAAVGDGGGYGNVVYLNHPGGLQTRYAHMSRFADGARVGGRVRAGDVIGYVGTTGASTGPHLHFEIHRNGKPIDPFSLGQGGTVMASGGGLTASDAVESLTNQIIQVESAGIADAKNPLSTATGLGQFIQSTWLRMMEDYRPDLYRTMSRADLLALRTDPTLSREMVKNLARENENFLRARGHQVDAGRLYLAHFLGPDGASQALFANDNDTVLNVMGARVVNANPFLRNYTIGDLEVWAQRKMRGAGTATNPVPSTPRPPPLTAEMRDFIKIVDKILAEVG